MKKLIIIILIFWCFFPGILLAKSSKNSNFYGIRLCASSTLYDCQIVKKGDTWATLFPNEVERDLIMRINRFGNKLRPGLKLAVPKELDLKMLNHAPLPLEVTPTGRKQIRISLSKQAFGAYEADGTLIYWGPTSSAKGYCPDVGRRCTTPTGNFFIQSKRGSGCFSTKYPVGRGGAPMPYCMFYYKGYALHGSYDLPGYNASHGCIRLLVKDAKWLNQVFTAGEKKMPVIVSP